MEEIKETHREFIIKDKPKENLNPTQNLGGGEEMMKGNRLPHPIISGRQNDSLSKTPKKDRNKKIAIVIFIATLFLTLLLINFLWYDAFKKKDNSINIQVPENPTTNNFQNTFPTNNTIIVNVDMGEELNKTIESVVKTTLKQLNLTNSSG